MIPGEAGHWLFRAMTSAQETKCLHGGNPMDALPLLQILQSSDLMETANIIFTVHAKDPRSSGQALTSLARVYTSHPKLCTAKSRKVLLGLAVDAFLNHDYITSVSFCKLACFSKHIESIGSAEKFFQQTLSVNTRLGVGSEVEISDLQSATQYNGMVAKAVAFDSAKGRWIVRLPSSDEIKVKAANLIVKSEPPGALTPWGTPAQFRLKAGEEPLQFVACSKEIKNFQINEMYLLCCLQDEVPCSCLDVENPCSARFGEILDPTMPPPDIVTQENASKRFPYLLDCARCRAERAAGAADFKRCSRCRMVRYCSAACQLEDWPHHRVRCPNSALIPAWWGRMTSAA
jgi:hypothetical protein